MSVRLTRSGINLVALLDEVSATSNGASVLFTGTVRDNHDERSVLGLDYSAYEPMAEKVMREIVAEASREFATEHIALVHRLGELDLGEVSVAIAVAHPHRSAAFDAARYIIEELKRRVPIWKREHYVDGTREWVDPSGHVRKQEVVE